LPDAGVPTENDQFSSPSDRSTFIEAVMADHLAQRLARAIAFRHPLAILASTV
jgi:hypothetical protein